LIPKTTTVQTHNKTKQRQADDTKFQVKIERRTSGQKRKSMWKNTENQDDQHARTSWKPDEELMCPGGTSISGCTMGMRRATQCNSQSTVNV
jgi:hypothetical protein